MSDAPRDNGVFGALEPFESDDAIDPMLLHLPTTEPADWALDPLTPDLYPLSYMEPPLPSTTTPSSPKHSPPELHPPPPHHQQQQQQPPAPPPPSTSRKRPPPPSPSPSSTSGKRVPTAVCTFCGKAVSNNGANFRRHEQACRRSRTSTPPAPAALTRDADLVPVVQRLQSSIASLDVSARVCLRDALVSLSNKAANPTATPTPQQEAMNRAAEYLVLRMLFLSGAQLMHTAPGTAPPYASSPPIANHDAAHAANDSAAAAAATGMAVGGNTVQPHNEHGAQHVGDGHGQVDSSTDAAVVGATAAGAAVTSTHLRDDAAAASANVMRSRNAVLATESTSGQKNDKLADAP